MSTQVKLGDMIDTINGMNDVDSVKSYCLSLISTLQKELQNTKYRLQDFRNTYGLAEDPSGPPNFNLLVDPVVNGEILHLKKQLQRSNEEVTRLRDVLDVKEYNPESPVGQHLISRVRALKVENKELSKIVMESLVQPLSQELNSEREMNRALDKKLKSLHLLNVQLKKDNNHLSQRVSELNNALSKSRRDLESGKRERNREHSSSFSRSRRSMSLKRRSASPSPKKRNRMRSPPYSKHSDKQGSHRSSNRPPSRDRSRTRPPRSRH